MLPSCSPTELCERANTHSEVGITLCTYAGLSSRGETLQKHVASYYEVILIVHQCDLIVTHGDLLTGDLPSVKCTTSV